MIDWQHFNGDAAGFDAASGLRYDITCYTNFCKLKIHNASAARGVLEDFATLADAKAYAHKHAASVTGQWPECEDQAQRDAR
jgi:hypothetical protein